jgi:hypothetical protein
VSGPASTRPKSGLYTAWRPPASPKGMSPSPATVGELQG